MAKNKTQLLRLVFIDQKIREGMQSGKYANCTTIAREYEVSSKSILRDIDYLKNIRDVPIAYDQKKKGYFYTEDNFKLPAMDMSASDLFALCVTEKVLKQHENTPIYTKLQSVFRRIQATLPETVSINPSWLNANISVIGDYRTSISPDIWAIIAESLQHSQQIIFSYRKPGETKSSLRQISPYHLVSFQGEWYVIGHCKKRQSVLTFAVSRIVKARMSSQTFTLPDDFDYKTVAAKQFGIFSGEHSFNVTIVFNKDVAPYVQERQWHPTQTGSVSQDGSYVLTMTTSHLLEVKKWVLSWGSGAEVVAPKELRNAIVTELRQMQEKYEKQ